MQKGEYLDAILRSDKTVFSLKDIALLWQDDDTDLARVRLSYYVKRGNLLRIRRGLYVKDHNYNKLELATKVFTPSYVSFETILAREGLIFQYQTEITVASYLSRSITIDGQVYSYRKMKNTILTNTAGIHQANNSAIAFKERAFLDTLYHNRDYHFDNARSLDWREVKSLAPLYDNKRLVKKVNTWLENRPNIPKMNATRNYGPRSNMTSLA